MHLLPLAGLALVDSLSLGTFVIPLGLIIFWKGVKARLLGIYLATITIAYFLLGMALLLGFSAAFSHLSAATDSKWFNTAMLIIGIALAAYGILAPTPKKREHYSGENPTATKLRAKGSSPVAIASLALGACVIEAATMLPYLAAIGMIETLDAPFIAKIIIMATYCLIMIAPAASMAALAMLIGPKLLKTVTRWIPELEYQSKVTLLWIAAIAGIYIAATSYAALERL
ncbi:GAP family protein [Corynebacterium aquilae]|uniref:Sap, sulfolipid-1-addressing protein n=1 Tax=Corynebacterium aquilae DSM 44791 TaxID=1431546 RepID=A0A1L7CHS4_9CORY|nr:GAP family protein [Corynebacterium aquilae]APT85407.1 hypothetical protein CAQU_10500 [Corynebacterium aquilae DSM 44791]